MKTSIFLLCLISLAVSLPIEVEEIDRADEDYEEYLEEVARSEGLSLVDATSCFS